MSRTKQTSGSTGPTNPSTLFAEWDSINSQWKYWDKEAEAEKTLAQATPFIVLDQLTTVKGYNEPQKKAYWSNEVRRPSDKITVRSKDGTEQEGTWRELKSSPIANHIKYTKSVYVLAKVGSTYQLCNFQLKGSSLTAWIEFVDEIGGDKALYGDNVIAVREAIEKKKGAVVYNSPVFGIVSNTLSDEAAQQADEADKVLQEYLEVYMDKKEDEGSIEPEATDTETGVANPTEPEYATENPF